MKKLFIVISLVLISAINVFDNPVYVPPAYLSEFTFDKNNNWVMEITFDMNIGGYLNGNYDSICVASAEDTARVRLGNVKDSTLILIINSDSLSSPLYIDKKGDCVKLLLYLSKNSHFYFSNDSIKFGNYPGSLIDSIPSGYSLCRYGYDSICKCKNSTIGLPNSVEGTYFTLKGHIFNKRGYPITNGLLKFDYYLNITNDGTYSTKIFSRELNLSFIRGYYEIESYQIEPFHLNVNPDTMVEHDIHLLGDIMSAERNDKPENAEVSIINYPNPFNLSTNFYVKIPSFLEQKRGYILIYNVNGRKIKSIPVSNGSVVIWNGVDSYGRVVSSGVYYYRFEINNKIYKNGSMILLK